MAIRNRSGFQSTSRRETHETPTQYEAKLHALLTSLTPKLLALAPIPGNTVHSHVVILRLVALMRKG
jgi:hypothetical protein